ESIKNDGLKLDAWYVPAEHKTNNTVIVVHGFRQDKSAMRQYGQLFHELGYNVLMPDNRGAGQSEGKFITFGYHDKFDVIAWANYLTYKN
ncbi:alpha/beta hydrolase, partial [Klebsiella variicola]|uniref:alpha/beta hydrolase n=1 Tax=Klebsiella variicola TaxID=244366 RepID=UPI0039C1F908